MTETLGTCDRISEPHAGLPECRNWKPILVRSQPAYGERSAEPGSGNRPTSSLGACEASSTPHTRDSVSGPCVNWKPVAPEFTDWINEAVAEIQQRNRERGHVLKAVNGWADVMPSHEMANILDRHARKNQKEKNK